jgi:hypothetical protein
MENINAAAQKIPPFILSSEKLLASWPFPQCFTACWAIGKWTQEDSFTMERVNNMTNN